MKTSTILSVAAALAAPALAQDLSGLPTCAQTCAISAVGSSGCALTDIACICAATAFLSTFETCIGSGCSTADQATAATFGTQFCASAGVSVAASGASASVTNTAAASSAASSVSSAVSSAISSAAASVSSVSSSVSMAVSSSMAHSNSTATAAHNGTASMTSAPVQTYTGAAGSIQASGAIMAGFAMVGFLGLA